MDWLLKEIKEIIANSNINRHEIIKKRLKIIESEIARLTVMKDNLYKMLKENKVIKARNLIIKYMKLKLLN